MDKFHEQLLTTRKSPLFTLMNVFMIFFGFLSVMALSILTGGFNTVILAVFLICAAVAVGAYFLRDKMYKEYEYTFTNGNLQIDIIYNMKKRKVIFDKDVKDFEEFGRLNGKGFPRDVKIVECYPSDKKDAGDIYYVLTSGKQRTAYLIIPDKEIIDYINLYYKRRIR